MLLPMQIIIGIMACIEIKYKAYFCAMNGCKARETSKYKINSFVAEESKS